MKNKVGIYLHIPFCRRKCLYCDFCSFEGSDPAAREAYVEALCREITAYREVLSGYEADTVYIGGGTPSLLTAGQTARLLDTLRGTVPLTADAEVTGEVNPATADREKLCAWREAGMNRLSIGVQSFSDGELLSLGRLHTADEAERFVRLAQDSGYDNVSLDLMYGIPGQTPASFAETLRRAVALSPAHISAYALQIEEDTPFARMNLASVLPDEDTEADMYEACVTTLAGAGYRHYEISNYARPGYESRHNLRYWRREEYLGFGLAAHSFFGGRRWGCDRNLSAYLTRRFIPFTGEVSESTDPEYETVMLGLRLAEGIDEESFRARFGYGFWEKYGDRLAPYVGCGLVRHREGRTSLTDRGQYVSLGFLSEILDE